MLKKYLLILSLFVTCLVFAQQKEVDRLLDVLGKKQADSNRVKTLNDLAYVYNLYNPAQGLITSQQAVDLAKKIRFYDGEARALSIMANSFNITGNYNRAMEIYLKQLEIAEQRNHPGKLASLLMNIGILHTQQQDYVKALPYYLRSDSIIRANKLVNLEYFSFQNLGDIYDRLNKIDSAFYYYNKSLAHSMKDTSSAAPYYMGASLIGLGNCYVKLKKKDMGMANYYQALHYLRLANEVDLYCETANNMAKLYDEKGQKDSALNYAHIMLGMAKRDHFQSRILDATTFLSGFYKKQQNGDSAFYYLEQANMLKDSINGLEKIKDFQQKTFGEEVRQAELAEKKRKEEEERSQQLQLLIIGLFIPVFFLLTVFLSQKKIHRKAIQVLGIISLLLLFEYLTLFLHPFVLEITHHTPVFELLIFVCIAAVLIPAHHRIEHWLIEKLTRKHQHPEPGKIHIRQSKIEIKKPS